jgi:hypothetical protein
LKDAEDADEEKSNLERDFKSALYKKPAANKQSKSLVERKDQMPSRIPLQ